MNDNDDDNIEPNINEEFSLHSAISDTSERQTFLEHFIPRQTIRYIQYCLLRIPLLLIYDYLFTDQFISSIEYYLQYLIRVIDQENEILFKPVSFILHSYFFQVLVHLNLNLSIPVLGKIYVRKKTRKIFFARRFYIINSFVIML